MAAFPFSALSLILVLASSTRFEAAEGFTLEQTVQKLIVNHVSNNFVDNNNICGGRKLTINIFQIYFLFFHIMCHKNVEE